MFYFHAEINLLKQLRRKHFVWQRKDFLLEDHAYFQVQMQMRLHQVKFCDFVMWGKWQMEQMRNSVKSLL